MENSFFTIGSGELGNQDFVKIKESLDKILRKNTPSEYRDIGIFQLQSLDFGEDYDDIRNDSFDYMIYRHRLQTSEDKTLDILLTNSVEYLKSMITKENLKNKSLSQVNYNFIKEEKLGNIIIIPNNGVDENLYNILVNEISKL